MTINIQPPTPLRFKFPGDPIIVEHDQAMQMMYEALLALDTRVKALEDA